MSNAQEMTRREALKLAAASALAATLPLRLAKAEEAAAATRTGTLAEVLGTEWNPLFLTDGEGHTTAVIADAIIPRTDTPGALDARAHEFIDLILSVDSERNQGRFRDGLTWMNERSQELHGAAFVDISDEQRVDILKTVSDEHKKVDKELRTGWRFFKDIKRRTLDAYYTSREGLVEELGRPEGHLHRPYQGCRHGGGSHA